MTYRDYIRGDEALLGVAPTGYRYTTETNEGLPVTPETVANHVQEAVTLGASVAHLHGRDGSGAPDPGTLPQFGSAVRENCDDVLVEYAAGPDCERGDLLAAIDEQPRPDLASVRLGPEQHGYRETSAVSRRDTDEFVQELTDRGVKPNLLVTSGRDLNEVQRLREESALERPPVVTLLFGADVGTVATPSSVRALLGSVPDDTLCLVRATGPNQFPLTSLAFFLGAHPVVGMEDNLFLDVDTPVQRNAQLVRRVAELASHSRRDIVGADGARTILDLPDGIEERTDVEA